MSLNNITNEIQPIRCIAAINQSIILIKFCDNDSLAIIIPQNMSIVNDKLLYRQLHT